MSELAGGCSGPWPKLTLLMPAAERPLRRYISPIANYDKSVTMQGASLIDQVASSRRDEVGSADAQLSCGDLALIERIQFECIPSSCARAAIEILKSHM